MIEINSTPFYGICFLQEDKGRDTEIALPIVYAAEKFLNCKVDFVLKWNAHLIYKKKPDFIILPANSKGSKIFHDIAKYAHSQNIKIFSFVSEGNFNVKRHRNIFGYNTEKHFYQDYICAWSERTRVYMQEKNQAQKEQIVLTGAAGFDRFTIYEYGEREKFLAKYGKSQFKKVISYSGWGFGKAQYEQGRMEAEADESKRDAKIAWMNAERIAVRDSLKQAIESFPDVLFVLKQHPSEYYPGLVLKELNEMSELTDYENVLYVRGQSEGIHDVISIADIVLGFETTSAIETWVMGDKPTIFLNRDVNFPRVNIYEGCLIAKNKEELVDYIKEFYASGKIESFFSEELVQKREKIIVDTIGYKDGFNHLRHLKYLNKTLLKIDKKQINYKKSSYFSKLYLFFIVMKPLYKLKLLSSLPWFSKFNWVFERYRLDNIKVLKRKYKPFMESFYQQKQVDKDFLSRFWE